MFRFDAVPSAPSGGTPDTVDYNTQVQNKPQIEGTTLSGNKTLAQLKIQGILSTENPLKLTDNKITLQVDNQLLQISSTGELTINLDEVNVGLTNKLNSDVDNITSTGEQAIKNIVGTIPTKTSDLTNDSNFITNTVNNLTNYTPTSGLATVAISGSFEDLTHKPVIPSEYTLPTASTTTLGGVKVDGTTVTIDGDGVISSHTTGTSDYTALTNKPQIGGVELSGNKSLSDLGIQPAGTYLTEIPDTVQLKTDNSLATTNKTVVGAINEINTALGSKADTSQLPASTALMSGTAPTVTDLTASEIGELVTALNAILAQLRTRGVIA